MTTIHFKDGHSISGVTSDSGWCSSRGKGITPTYQERNSPGFPFTHCWDGITPLGRAAEEGNIEEVDFLIASGVDLNVGRVIGFPISDPLNDHIVGMVDGRNMHFNIGDDSPIVLAAKRGHVQVVARLFKAGALTRPFYFNSFKSIFGWEEFIGVMKEAGLRFDEEVDK